MMGLDDRLTYFILGCGIGILIGYAVRSLRDIDEKVTEMDELVKRDHDEAGFLRLPTWLEIKFWILGRWDWFRGVRLKSWTLALVVFICVFASFQTQHVNNDLRANDAGDKRQQDQIERISECNSDFLGKTISALNERTTYSKEQAQANIDLQIGFQTFLRVLTLQPPPTTKQSTAAFVKYFEKLNAFVDLAKKSQNKVELNPYPTLDEFSDCVNSKEKK